MSKPTLLVFASGTAESGGSGFQKLVEATHTRVLDADIVGVVSNHANGGVRQKADRLGIRFIHFPKPWDAASYQRIALSSGAEFFPLSGWIKHVKGLDLATPFNSQTVINIHPGLPEFGGTGMYGHHVHEAAVQAFERGEITRSGLCMHFVDPIYDHGPIFLRCFVEIIKGETADQLGDRVNAQEHIWQPPTTNLVVHREITWDGINPNSLILPQGYSIDRAA